MSWSKRWWMITWAPFAVAGLGLGLRSDALTTITLAGLAGIVTAAVTWVWTWDSNDIEGGPRSRLRVVAANALVVGAAFGAAVGFVGPLGLGALVLLVLVLATSPYAVGAFSTWLRSMPSLSTIQLEKVVTAMGYACPEYLAMPPPAGIDLFSDEELCRNWQTSYQELQLGPSQAATAAIVSERQVYLDELERRDPRGFAAWLASGAHASQSPLPYLGSSRNERPAINWDELTRGQG